MIEYLAEFNANGIGPSHLRLYRSSSCTLLEGSTFLEKQNLTNLNALSPPTTGFIGGPLIHSGIVSFFTTKRMTSFQDLLFLCDMATLFAISPFE